MRRRFKSFKRQGGWLALNALVGFGSGESRKVANITLSANQANYLLNTAKVSGYEAGNTDVVLTINSGVVIGSTSTSTFALDVDTSWAAGDTVKIINPGTIEGAGGAGGASNGGSGGAGGPALRCQRAVSVDNTGGVIASGGNGGTGGANGYCAITYGVVGSGKEGPIYGCQGGFPQYPAGGAGGKGAGAGASGTYSAAAGSTGATYSDACCTSTGATGNTGGALGGGAYITGNANVTWIANGTRTGSVA